MKPLTILSVAFPLAPVSADAVGGSEQVVSLIDRALVEAGHRSLVVACEGSRVAGMLLATPALRPPLDDGATRRAVENHRRTICDALGRYRVDVVHLHGVDFHQYLPPEGVPVVATVHMPPDSYPPEVFYPKRPNTFLHCVSRTQQRACPPGARLLPVIENGVDVERLATHVRKRDYALVLGRICPEKGQHLALDAAAEAGAPAVLAGHVFPYEVHLRYFREEIQPRLGPRCFLRDALPLGRKRRLLAGARCLLVPSLVAETSSLVSMEAFACGTPVIAFRSGALVEVVEHGATGTLVNNVREMAEAIRRIRAIDPARCREVARKRFSAQRMTGEYLNLYRRLARDQVATGTD